MEHYQILLYASVAALFTFLGGLFALKFYDQKHLILAFSSGAVMGVALFDLLPESVKSSPNLAYLAIAFGFALYFVINNYVGDYKANLGGGSLTLHSIFDGIGIGLGFQVSVSLGLIIALAVVAHDFSDGLNTINIILKNNGSKLLAFKWLIADSVAPIIGATSTLFFKLPQDKLGIVLGVFTGFFLFIGASNLIPECKHSHSKHLTNLFMCFGMIVLWLVTRIAG